MASVSDPDSDADTEASSSSRTPPRRRGPPIVSSDPEDDSEPERPPRHLRAPSRTPSWAKSVSRSPSPVIVRRGRTGGGGGGKGSVSPGIGRWGEEEHGYESAESGRIRLREERSPSVLREQQQEEEEDEDDGGVAGSESEVGASSGESGAEGSEDEVEGGGGELEAPSAIGQQLSPDRTGRRPIERRESPDQELQSEAGSGAEEGGGGEEASGSGPEANIAVEPGAETESEVEDRPEPLDEPEDSSEPEDEPAPGPEPEDEAEFADESQLETQPTHELPPSIHSHANSVATSGPATPSPSEDDSGGEGEKTPLPYTSPNKRHAAPPDSPSTSDHSEAGTEADPEDGSEEEFTDTRPAATTTSSASKSRQKRAIQSAPKITGRRRGRQVNKYKPRYMEILNDQIALAASRGLNELEYERERVTPVLGSLWTRKERDMFFKYLAIVGKDNVAELARLIGTKSAVECRAYVKALQDGREHDWHAPVKRWVRERDIVSSRDIPAAVELSNECVEALEEEADALEVRIRKDEERREKVKWGDLWRLDATSSWTIEQLYKANKIDEIRKIAPEAELLNIYNMLEISESIFMNGSSDNHNWQFLGSDPPAIRHTAFKDLHTLIVSLTRRIVQTTIYMATSRLRGMESQVFGPTKLIRPIDVEAAVNCLHLPENSREYWIRIPRRTGLHVYNRKEDIRKRSNKGFIPYDELEQVLRHTRAYGSGSGVNSGDNNDEEDDNAVEAKMDALLAAAYVERGNNDGRIKDEDVLDPMDTEVSDLSFEADTDDDDEDEDEDDHDDESHESTGSDVEIDGTFRSKPQKKTDLDLEAIDDAEDVYLEALDKKRSYKEEKALWKFMGRKPSQPLPKIEKPLPGPPPLERKRPLDFMNWRDSAGYLAPWETDKRRKTEHYGGLWGDDESSPTFHSATLPEPQRITKVHRHEAIPNKKKKKPTAKKQKQAKVISPVKAMGPPTPREGRTRKRRQSKLYSGFVSTIDNIIESDQEALARELQDDDSFSEESAD